MNSSVWYKHSFTIWAKITMYSDHIESPITVTKAYVEDDDLYGQVWQVIFSWISQKQKGTETSVNQNTITTYR